MGGAFARQAFQSGAPEQRKMIPSKNQSDSFSWRQLQHDALMYFDVSFLVFDLSWTSQLSWDAMSTGQELHKPLAHVASPFIVKFGSVQSTCLVRFG